METTYKSAGVDIDAAARFIKMLKERIARAWPGLEKEIGGFAGGVNIPRARKIKGSVDGTGTKIDVATMLGKNLRVVGQDAAAMGFDVYAAGSMPACAFDYLSVDHLVPEHHIELIEGVIDGCLALGCPLVGGETAEEPDKYKYPWMVGLNVTVIGVPRRELAFVPVEPGQRVYGWPSFGPGANGFSLLRKVFRLKGKPEKARAILEAHSTDLGTTLGEALLKPSPIWLKEIERQRELGVKFAGHAHITGGGMIDNIPRILPKNCKVVIYRNLWKRPPIFRLAQELGHVREEVMDRTFNQGIMVASIIGWGGGLMDNSPAHFIGAVVKRQGDEPQIELVDEYDDE